jgi:hypothetical protein
MLGRLLLALRLVGGMWWLLCRICPGRERIQINAPATFSVVTSPLTVSGVGQATQHNQLGLRVRDTAGTEVGTGSASVAPCSAHAVPSPGLSRTPLPPAGDQGALRCTTRVRAMRTSSISRPWKSASADSCAGAAVGRVCHNRGSQPWLAEPREDEYAATRTRARKRRRRRAARPRRQFSPITAGGT